MVSAPAAACHRTCCEALLIDTQSSFLYIYSVASSSQKSRKRIRLKYERKGPGCPLVPYEITSLGRYFEVFNSVLRDEDVFWFRGHADATWTLTPSALRYEEPAHRNEALNLLSDFKRFGEMKLQKPPPPDEELKWIQLAQHYGLPTRLLDWTKNAAIALYFACLKPSLDGGIFILNPVDLNRQLDPKRPRVYDSHLDADIIKPYLELSGRRYRGKHERAVAIHPVWNSERIMLQQGVFTLHGSYTFALTAEQAPSLVYVKISKQHKQALFNELERMGVTEMSIFPEAEHMCHYLKQSANLF